MKRYKNATELAVSLGLPKEFGQLAELKARLTGEIVKKVNSKKITHQEIADLTGIPRSAVTGIINNSMQKVTLDRLLRIIWALGLEVEFKIKKAA